MCVSVCPSGLESSNYKLCRLEIKAELVSLFVVHFQVGLCICRYFQIDCNQLLFWKILKFNWIILKTIGVMFFSSLVRHLAASPKLLPRKTASVCVFFPTSCHVSIFSNGNDAHWNFGYMSNNQPVHSHLRRHFVHFVDNVRTKTPHP